MSQFSSVTITNWCFLFTAGGVLLFITHKLDTEQVAANLDTIATTRGLDIPSIKAVIINYDVAKTINIDTHTHWIGQTGWAGRSHDV